MAPKQHKLASKWDRELGQARAPSMIVGNSGKSTGLLSGFEKLLQNGSKFFQVTLEHIRQFKTNQQE